MTSTPLAGVRFRPCYEAEKRVPHYPECLDLRGKFGAIHREYSPNPRKFYAFCTSVTDTATTAGIIASGTFLTSFLSSVYGSEQNFYQCATWWSVNISSNLNCCNHIILLIFYCGEPRSIKVTNSPLAIPYRQKYLGDVYLPFSVGSTIFYFIHLHIQALAARILSLDPILCYLRRLCDNDYHDNYPPNHLQRFTNHNQYPHKLPSPPKKTKKKNTNLQSCCISSSSSCGAVFIAESPVTHAMCTFFPSIRVSYNMLYYTYTVVHAKKDAWPTNHSP